MKKKSYGLCFWHCSSSKLLLKMKLLTLMLFLSVASMAATSYAQQTKFTIKYEQITLAEVFKKIEQSSEFIFLYSEKSVNLQREVTISVENKNVNFILDQLFEGTNNYYEIKDR